MKGSEVRERFLNYFKKHGHKVLPSSSLVPSKDPTLLFTNAGMVQFKGAFLGYEDVGTNRATTSQKCLRVSGKHNDLENVGYTARHHTFFEMLGNFSFGDYFKEEAIFFGWDFLTKDLGIDSSRLYVSVFRDDDEAHEIWKDEMGLPDEKIYRFDEEDNFWSMGDTGPCGPCSEILYDQGEEVGCGKPSCTVGCECDRYLEIWNLVFMQYDRDGGGKLAPLPKPSIDTGMGLERVTAIVQGVTSNYETDFFAGIIEKLVALSGKGYGKDEKLDSAMRVIADHGRASAFLIADGVLPANEGRGYVLRRIMRRALRHGKKLDFSGVFLHKVTDSVIDELGNHYSELRAGREFVEKVVINEEERFLATLDGGLKIFEEEAAKVTGKNRIFPGDVAFKLYDTYGFPLDLTQDICRERGLTVNIEHFDTEMADQKERARSAWKGGEISQEKPLFPELVGDFGGTLFTGYEERTCTADVIAISSGGESAEEILEGAHGDVVTSKTPFYAEGGGQVGDRGVIKAKEGELEVTSTYKLGDDLYVHRGKVTRGGIHLETKVTMEVDDRSRGMTESNHTATHLLQAALRKILGEHVRQAGSYVGPDKLRFDYTHFDHVDPAVTEEVEKFVNEVIMERREVTWDLVEYEAAISQGAMAFFGEKYDDMVRMVTVSGVSRELCGGTHVRNTGDIGFFVISEERSLSSGVRRIEAYTGLSALDYLHNFRSTLLKVSRQLNVSPDSVEDRVEKLLEDLKKIARERDEIKRRALRGDILSGGLEVRKIGEVSLAIRLLDGVDVRSMREMMDELKGKVKDGVVYLGSREEGKCTILVGVTKNLTEHVDARDAVKAVSIAVGGRGGGRADLSQTGSSNTGALEEGLSALVEYLQAL